MEMLGFPLVLHSVLFLLMLLPSLFSTGNFLYQYPDWENYPGLGLGSRNFHHHEDQSPRHMWHRRNSRGKICQALPDIYFVIDKLTKDEHLMVNIINLTGSGVAYETHFWTCVGQIFYVGYLKWADPCQELRVSIITFSCKGNIILPITQNREEILKGLERVKYSMPAGHEYLSHGLFRANEQMKKNISEGIRRPSAIICVLNGPLDRDAFKYTVEEADYARKMGATVFIVGVGRSVGYQISKIAGKAENTFANKGYSQLKGLVFPLISKICPYLISSDTQIICIGESKPVVLRGYGFDFVMNKEDIICRFYLSDIDMSFREVKPTNITKDTVVCPGPIVDVPGKVIFVLLSLDNGENFMNNDIYVASKLCGKTLPARGTTTIRAMRPVTQKTTQKTTTTTMSTSPSTTTTTSTTTITSPTTTTTPRTNLWTTTGSHTTIPTYPLITERPKPSFDKFILVPIFLGLLLSMLLFGCFWQLCCLLPVEEMPPSKPQPQPRKKKQPPSPVSPPAPAPPVNPSPIVIVCCCTCRGLCVSRDMEGNVTVCHFHPPSCHQLPLMWPQCDDQGWCTDFALLKALCAEDPCGPRVIMPPSQECLPLASCSQCHQFSDNCSWFPSRLQLLASPSWAPRTPLSLPHMQ